jgi:hypothetical protein
MWALVQVLPIKHNNFCLTVTDRKLFNGIAGNGQGLLQGWNSLLVCPEPLLIKDIKVQVNKQKPNSARPAQMKHNNDMTRPEKS